MISILQEISKWKEMAIDGLLSNKSLGRLSKTGIRKPFLDYLDAFNRGDEKISNSAAKLLRTKTIDPETKKEIIRGPGSTRVKKLSNFKNRGENAGSYFEKENTIKLARDYNDKKPFILSPRHERYENYYTNLLKKKEEKLGYRFVNNTTGKEVGNHAHPGVMWKHKKDSDTLKSIYPHLKSSTSSKKLDDYFNKQGKLFTDKKDIKDQVKIYNNSKNTQSDDIYNKLDNMNKNMMNLNTKLNNSNDINTSEYNKMKSNYNKLVKNKKVYDDSLMGNHNLYL